MTVDADMIRTPLPSTSSQLRTTTPAETTRHCQLDGTVHGASEMTSGVFHCLRVELFYCVTRDVVSPLSGRGDSVALATNKVKMDATLLTSCLLPF